MLFTMVDNKVCNAVTNTSSAMRCFICQSKPTEMNDLNRVSSTICEPEHFQFGISSLHAWIRCMKCILHISYNLPFKKWTANTVDLKKQRDKRKSEIQDGFRKEMGLYVDYVKQGWGSSNDGNTARRFFSDAKTSAKITGVDLTLIKRFHVILQVISSPYDINTEKFRKYTHDTAVYYVQTYGWYYMPASIHKILVHGAEIIEHALLPIGQLSEEAQEVCIALAVSMPEMGII
ncbi:uncharacterized protein LOC143213857 [Lasioglossum baleicum]|uniref:uncharacterized protein LOC143213857 n=1 Tax=Lasioglossum baleicum TaxID=434251 RepID=UPI003FCC5DFF